MTLPPIRNLAHWLMAATFHAAPDTKDDWATAMATELDYIPSDFAALEFSIGCLFASLKENIRMQRYEPLLRWFLAICILFWAMAKGYLLIAVTGHDAQPTNFAAPNWFILATIGSGIAYGSGAYFLFGKKFLSFGVMLVCALIINSATLGINALQYGKTGFQGTDNLTFFLALISEDYFIWSAILLGIAGIWAFKNSDHLRNTLSRS